MLTSDISVSCRISNIVAFSFRISLKDCLLQEQGEADEAEDNAGRIGNGWIQLETFFCLENVGEGDDGHEGGRNAGNEPCIAVCTLMIEVNGTGPEDDHSQGLVCPGEVTPYDIEINLGKKSADGQQGDSEGETFCHALLVHFEPVSQCQAGCAESGITGSDRAGNDAKHGEDSTDTGTHVADADIIDSTARTTCFQDSLQSAGSVKECNTGSSPDEADHAFGNHGTVEYGTAKAFVLQAAGHDRGLGGMETGDSAAGHGDEHERPDGELVISRIEVCEDHFRHGVATDTHQHAAGNTEGHNDEADTENRIEPGNDFIDRKKGCQEIVGKDHDEPGENLPAGQFRQQHSRAGHEYGTNKNQQNDREETHDGQHGVAHVASDDFRNTVSVFPDGHHAGEVIMYAAGKNGAENNPEIYRRTPEGTAESAKDRSKAGNV